MKQTKKWLNIFKMIFGYGIMIVLFVGASTFLGYIAALIIGGAAAVAICDFIYLRIIPVMVFSTTVLVVWGILCLYLSGEKAMIPKTKYK